MFRMHYANSDCKIISPGTAWINPARQVQKHLKPTDQVNKDRDSLICETAFAIQGKQVIKDISRRFKYLFIQLRYKFLSGGMWSWTRRSKNRQRCKNFGIFDCILQTISTER